MARRKHVGVRRVEKRGRPDRFRAEWYDETGTRRTSTCDTMAHAVAYREEMLRNVRRGASTNPTPGRTLFTDWAETWWAARDVRA